MTSRPPDFRLAPVSRKSRTQWRDNLLNLAADMALYGGTAYPDAMRLAPSTVADFFNSKSFQDWRKGEESRLKVQAAIVDRLNEVIRGTGIVARTVAKRRL